MQFFKYGGAADSSLEVFQNDETGPPPGYVPQRQRMRLVVHPNISSQNQKTQTTHVRDYRFVSTSSKIRPLPHRVTAVVSPQPGPAPMNNMVA